MRRTQLYLDEDVWNTLRFHSRQAGVTISELVRQTLRDRYVGQTAQRRKAMEDFVGIRRHVPEDSDATAYIRKLRQGNRLTRLAL